MPDEDGASPSRGVSHLSEEEEVKRVVTKVLGPYMDQQTEGFSRIATLLQVTRLIYEKTALPALSDRGKDDVAQDILRAAVVLIHAHLEEFLRTIARVLLPEADENQLNEIPLAGLGGRKDKFFLGKLVQHKGKFVDEVLKDSVSEYLERSNYNSTDEIGRLLATLGFEVSNHNSEFPAIQQMIERRHQIVHRADRFEADSSTPSLQPIEIREVTAWLSGTQALMFSLRLPLFLKLSGLKKRRGGTE